ncbi:MAG: hypothetical protein ABIV43_02540 [Candidatus Saccharimonadales bacterium]
MSTYESSSNDNDIPLDLLSKLSPREHQQYVNATFFSDLLDSREYYADRLAGLAHHDYQANGINAPLKLVPAELLDHVPTDNLDASLELHFATGPLGEFALKRFGLEFEDGPQLELNYDGFGTNLSVNGEEVALYLGSQLVSDTMRCMLPPGTPDMPPATLAYILHQRGQYQLHGMKAVVGSSVFYFESEETADDSRQLMQIDATLPEHASGKTITLQASLVEGLKNRMSNQTVRGLLDISARPTVVSDDAELYVDQIIERQIVRVERMTELHRQTIDLAMAHFEYEAAKQRRLTVPTSAEQL